MTIVELGEAQHGAVASWQLLALGITHQGIASRLGSGLLHRLHRGVYAVGRRRLTASGRCAAAVLAGGWSALLSHRAAALQIDLLESAPGPISVTVASKRSGPPTARFHRSAVPADERAVADGIPVTSASRTILDLAPMLADRRIERIIDRAERGAPDGGAPLPALLERYPRRSGTPRLRRVLAARSALTLTRSELEERFLAFVGRRGFERPEVNYPIRVGADAFELDCFWPRRRLAVELDGFQHHAGRSSFRDDRVRDRRLRTIGIETVRVTAHDLGPGAGALDRDLRAILG